ncbi:hypothetical protein GCM10009799_01990 [Nocardiopsis rhodophaea]|uniref:Transposase n=1 Tax=Nocardiopsis rhodophaea TaxID=280238 RepID=A0ABN2S504_9ACTN
MPRRRPREGEIGDHTRRTVPVRFTAYEIGRLLALLQPRPSQSEGLRRGLSWSHWRRCYQAAARACHRRRSRARDRARATARPPPRPSP